MSVVREVNLLAMRMVFKSVYKLRSILSAHDRLHDNTPLLEVEVHRFTSVASHHAPGKNATTRKFVCECTGKTVM